MFILRLWHYITYYQCKKMCFNGNILQFGNCRHFHSGVSWFSRLESYFVQSTLLGLVMFHCYKYCKRFWIWYIRQFVGFEFYKIIIHQNQTTGKILLQKVAKFKTQSAAAQYQTEKINQRKSACFEIWFSSIKQG